MAFHCYRRAVHRIHCTLPNPKGSRELATENSDAPSSSFTTSSFAAFLLLFLLASTSAWCEQAASASPSPSHRLIIVEGKISGTDPESVDVNALDPSMAAEETENLPPNQKASRLTGEIVKLLLSKKPDEAGVKFKQLEQLSPDAADLDSLRTAIMVGKGDYNGARVIYAEMVARNPKAFFPRFNMVELFMLESKFDEARKGFIALLDLYPDNPLVIYKIVLACLKENKRADADAWLARLNRPPVTAYFYYGNAAAAMADGNLDAARGWMIGAENDFQPGGQAWLHASLEDIGYAMPGDYPPK